MDSSDALISEFAVICARAGSATADQLLDDAVRVIARFIPSATSVALLDIPWAGVPGRSAVTGVGHEVVTAAQVSAHEGPCLDAATAGGVVVVDDLGHDRRWPTFVAAMVDRSPARAVLSVAVVDWMVLSVVSETPRALSGHRTLMTALSAASLTAMLLGHVAVAPHAEQLTGQVEAAGTVALAQGMIMERHDVDAPGALAFLAAEARRRSLSTVETAEQIVRARGLWPTSARAPRTG